MNPNDYLHSLIRITSVSAATDYKDDVLLFPDDVDFFVRKDSLVESIRFGEKDKNVHDLVRIIEIHDALNIIYKNTNILTPLVYAESLENIPYHITTQGLLFTRLEEDTISWVKQTTSQGYYGKHLYDSLWLPFCKSLDTLLPGEMLCIFNRRVAGWDGSHERPVIELLGAGGHLPSVWDNELHEFRSLSIKENIIKELNEELGVVTNQDRIIIFGGYDNIITHELVILCGVEIDASDLHDIYDYAVLNVDEDTQGIYLGTFQEVINYYKNNPAPFAGGAKAAPYNFPNQEELMTRVNKYVKSIQSIGQ